MSSLQGAQPVLAMTYCVGQCGKHLHRPKFDRSQSRIIISPYRPLTNRPCNGLWCLISSYITLLIPTLLHCGKVRHCMDMSPSESLQECWYGVSDPRKRKQIQDRLAQRARRRRLASQSKTGEEQQHARSESASDSTESHQQVLLPSSRSQELLITMDKTAREQQRNPWPSTSPGYRDFETQSSLDELYMTIPAAASDMTAAPVDQRAFPRQQLSVFSALWGKTSKEHSTILVSSPFSPAYVPQGMSRIIVALLRGHKGSIVSHDHARGFYRQSVVCFSILMPKPALR